MQGKPFKTVSPVHPGRSVFNLSYFKQFLCDMGQLIPVMCDEVVPGDQFHISNQVVIRAQPLVAPVLHEVNIYTHYFFVPYRILWGEMTGWADSGSWEDFITGGQDGQDASVLPRWTINAGQPLYSLWDYFGFPVNVVPTGCMPLDFPRRAYIKVWNDYYRDENLQDELDFDFANNSILYRNWSKDYFTSALEFQQKGTAPALPISGLLSAIFDADIQTSGYIFVGANSAGYQVYSTVTNQVIDNLGTAGMVTVGTAQPWGTYITIPKEALSDNTVDLSGALTFNVSDLRLAFQVQKWMERNNRCGVRYTEFLHAHFGVSPRDDRMMRPEYIGGSKGTVIFSEVLQTSASNSTTSDPTPQGNMSGHGILVNEQFCGSYHASEFGLIIGIMSVMPVPAYCQGINRQWLRESKFDFMFPEFVNLSEQAIHQVELYATAVENDNKAIFGYQGRYDEMRYKPNIVCGGMQDDAYNYWNLVRIFDSAPALNSDFIKCVPDKRIFAVDNEPGYIVQFGNVIKAIRPIPISAEPGLMDHN